MSEKSFIHMNTILFDVCWATTYNYWCGCSWMQAQSSLSLDWLCCTCTGDMSEWLMVLVHLLLRKYYLNECSHFCKWGLLDLLPSTSVCASHCVNE